MPTLITAKVNGNRAVIIRKEQNQRQSDVKRKREEIYFTKRIKSSSLNRSLGMNDYGVGGSNVISSGQLANLGSEIIRLG